MLTSDLRWRPALLYVAHCIKCEANYYPDSWTYAAPGNTRRQCLEYNAPYLRVSKHGIWVERRVAWMQELGTVHFHAGWSNFANWVNDLVTSKPLLTYRQSQRIFFEHFARRLLIAHNQDVNFSIPAHSTASELVSHVRDRIGINGGVFHANLSHGCANCTHPKRYYSDLVLEGLVPDAANPDEIAEAHPDVSSYMLPYYYIHDQLSTL